MVPSDLIESIRQLFRHERFYFFSHGESEVEHVDDLASVGVEELVRLEVLGGQVQILIHINVIAYCLEVKLSLAPSLCIAQ